MMIQPTDHKLIVSSGVHRGVKAGDGVKGGGGCLYMQLSVDIRSLTMLRGLGNGLGTASPSK
jgi:hypothetical protein